MYAHKCPVSCGCMEENYFFPLGDRLKQTVGRYLIILTRSVLIRIAYSTLTSCEKTMNPNRIGDGIGWRNTAEFTSIKVNPLTLKQ